MKPGHKKNGRFLIKTAALPMTKTSLLRRAQQIHENNTNLVDGVGDIDPILIQRYEHISLS